MKAIAIIFAVLFSGCVADEPCDEPTPIVYPDGTYCAAHLDSVEPSTGFLEGPCTTTVTIEMLCTQYDHENQVYNDMAISWESRKPGPSPDIATGIVGVTYRCNQALTVVIPGTRCEGTPFTVTAGFLHPTIGQANEGAFLCAEAKVVP